MIPIIVNYNMESIIQKKKEKKSFFFLFNYNKDLLQLFIIYDSNSMK
jgi:hypothetical protein